MSGHSVERLRCRCCGIASPDVGFTVSGDVLCDDCDTRLASQVGAATWRGFLADRARAEAARAEAEAAAKAAFVAHVGRVVFGART